MAGRTVGADYKQYNRIKQMHRNATDESGDAVVEAAILFPVMIMIFAALVLIATYLPSKALLQWSTQFAASALASQMSDTWLGFDETSMSYYWENDKERLGNVYANLFTGGSEQTGSRGETIVHIIAESALNPKTGELSVNCYVDNKIIYKEIIVEASRSYPMPVDLSIIRFPDAITVEAQATAVVQNGDEFIRNIDIASDFARYAASVLGLSDIGQSLGGFTERVRTLLGW